MSLPSILRRFDVTQNGAYQGPQGNFSIRSFNGSANDAFSGNLYVQNNATIAGVNDATGLGQSSLSTQGGIDCLKSLLVGQNGSILGSLNVTGVSNLTGAVNCSGSVTALSALIQSTLDNAINVPSGGVTAAALIANSKFISSTLATLSGSTVVNGSFSVTTATESINTSSGSIVTQGGVGINKSLNVGGSALIQTDLSVLNVLTSSTGIFTALTNASTSVIGALSTLGGLTVNKDAILWGDVFSGATLGTNKFRFTAQASNNTVTIVPDGTNPAISASTSSVLFGSSLQNVIIQSGTNATNSNSGALIVYGGGSFQKDLYVNGMLNLSGMVKSTNTVLFANSTASTLPSNGAVVIAGGLGVNQISVAGNVVAGLENVSASTSTTTGNLQSLGGAGIVGDVFVGGFLDISGVSKLHSGFVSGGAQSTIQSALIVNGTLTQNGNMAITNNTNPLTNTSPAALSITGGQITSGNTFINGLLSVGQNLSIAYNSSNPYQLLLAGPAATSNSSTLLFGSLRVYSGAFTVAAPTSNTLNLISDTGLNYIDSDSASGVVRFSVAASGVVINNTVDATSLGTAGFTTNSGASIAQSLIVGKSLQILGTTDATSLTAASVVIGGGLSVTKSLLVGANTNISGLLTVTGATTLNSTLNVAGLVSLTSALTSTSTASFAGSVIAGGTVAAQSSANCSWAGPTSQINAVGSLVSYGGAVIQKDLIIGGNQTLYGSASLKGNVDIGGNVHITSTTSSTSPTTAALIVDGSISSQGATVVGPMMLYGDMFLSGKLTATGTTQLVGTQDLIVTDNVISVNVGNKALDSGLAFHRWQESNDTGAGFVVSDPPAYTFQVTSSASDTVSIKLPTSASILDNFYSGWVLVQSGTGAGQVRSIKSYVGSTRVITINSTADQSAYNTANPPPSGQVNPVYGLDFTSPPDSTSTIGIYNTNIGVFLQQQLNTGPTYTLGFSAADPLNTQTTNTVITKYASLLLGVLSSNQSVKTNSILPFTNGGPVTINNSVQISPDGSLANVKNINGEPVAKSYSLQVSESASGLTGGTSIPIGVTYGTLSFVIVPSDDSGSRSIGTITCNKTSTVMAQSTATTSVAGVLGEQVDIVWTYGSQPKVTLISPRPVANQTGSPIPYVVHVLVY